jgi:hypothetical protein
MAEKPPGQRKRGYGIRKIIGVSRHAAILAAPEPMKIHEAAH